VISIQNWIIFQHHVVASGFNWNKTWVDYKNGFGASQLEDFWLGLERSALHGTEDFWMGLEKLHLLTTSGSYRLRLEWQESVTHYWFSTEYWLFYIDDESANYTMHAKGYVHGDDGRAL